MSYLVERVPHFCAGADGVVGAGPGAGSRWCIDAIAVGRHAIAAPGLKPRRYHQPTTFSPHFDAIRPTIATW